MILNIDTALPTASICLSDKGNPVLEYRNEDMKDHAAWLHPAIQNILKEAQIDVTELHAIAVSAGPGSYTGLRVGMSAAKGLCYALQKPLICISTLLMMKESATTFNSTFFCPMIDARRMEVFTAVYDRNNQEMLSPTNIILDPNSFSELLDQNHILFFGNGSEKFRSFCNHGNAEFSTIASSAKHLSPLSYRAFQNRNFADIAYSEPFYGKEFYSPSVKA